MATVELTARARADLIRLRVWLADKDAEVANRAVRAIVQRIDRLERFPTMAPRAKGSELRDLQIRFGAYGYVARYAVKGDRVIVSRIFHGREDR
jgi:plasmid stabilization system protein ParE